MTEEEKAFGRIKQEVGNSPHLELLGAHPPSGKSYSSDLITFRIPRQEAPGTKRDHIDLIFCSVNDIYLCEIKGCSSESKQDIEKLNRLLRYYEVGDIKSTIDKRLSWESSNLHEVSNVIKSIGCNKIDKRYNRRDFLFIEAKDGNLEINGYKSCTLRSLI